MRKFLLFTCFTLISVAMYAQTIVKGVVTDSQNEGLPGVSVYFDSTTEGTVTNFDGNFSMSTQLTGTKTVVVSFIGYKKVMKEVNLNGGEIDLGTIVLESNAIGLDEVQVVAAYVESSRQTPIAVSTIKTADLEEKLGNQEFPEMLKSTPGVYATKGGGGFGDSRINVRGFAQTNVAVMINGIPVNDMENGRVYWSNWAGLSDATKAMQVQRGLGASKLAINSVGGTINIITKTAEAEAGGTLRATIGNNGYKKTMLTLSSGLMDGGWAVTLAGSRTTGNGYIDGTWIDAWSYFASISKSIGDNHQLVFTAVGAPQVHGQRLFKSKEKVFENNLRGRQYNSGWGYYDGSNRFVKNGTLNERTNFYHKPQLALNHYWDISETMSLNTSAYVSFGRGGGTGGYGTIKAYKNLTSGTGLTDWAKIYDANVSKTPEEVNGKDYKLADYVFRASRNEHNWYGVLSTLKTELSEGLNLLAGIDARYYKGLHYKKIVDLVGADAFKEEKGVDVNRPDGYIAKVGDKIEYDNDGLVNWIGLFAQLEYKTEQFSAFVTGSFSNTGYKRVDRFKYKKKPLAGELAQETDWQNFIGFNAKAGFGYNINENQNVYVNAGYYSRAPIFDNVFPNNQNKVSNKTINESVIAAEIGYGLNISNFSMNLNGYYTQWNDRNFSKNVQDSNGDLYNAIISGQDALHMGVELDFVYKPMNNLSITGMLSIGDWQWKNDVDAKISPENEPSNIKEIKAYADGLKVGDAAQTTAALGLRYEFNKYFFAGIDYNFYDNLYANFDPTNRTDETDKGQWQMPSYDLFDVRVGYNFKISGMDAQILGNVQNLFDTKYISDGNDGRYHNQSSASFFYGFGRTWSASFKLQF